MKKRSLSILSAVALVAGLMSLSTASFAADDSGHFYVGGSTGYFKPDRDRMGGNTRSLGFQGGYQFSERWGVELGYQQDAFSPGKDDLTMYDLEFVRYWGSDVRVLFEFGYTHVALDVDTPNIDRATAGFHIGTGVSAFVTDNLELRGDLKLIDTQNGGLLDGMGTLSLNYHFGRAASTRAAAKPVLGSSYGQSQSLPAIQQREPIQVEPAPEPIVEEVPAPTVTHTLVNFSSDSIDIAGQYGDQLEEISSEITRTNSRAVVEGHTDSQGRESYNKTLSMDRAIAVKRHLKKNGVSGSDLNVVGYGEERPVADNETADGREQNRRVEIKLYDK